MKKTLSVIVAFIIMMSMLPVPLRAEDQVYYVGDDITVTINAADKVLTVSGSGELPDYSTASTCPWYRNANAETVIIEHGITKIGNRCFYGNTAIKTVRIGDTVSVIGKSAFYGCSSITFVQSSGEIRTIEDGAFA